MKNPYSTVVVKSEEEGIPSAENPDVLPLSEQEILRFGQDTEHRRWLVKWMMWVVSIWLALVIIITALSNIILHIDVNVMCVLLATTTINVLGLSKIILNGLFGEQNRRKSKIFSKKERQMFLH